VLFPAANAPLRSRLWSEPRP